jgi:hypothetical protein
MRAARSLADAAVVLSHGITMTRELRPGRAWPGGLTLDGMWPLGRPLSATTAPPARRDDDSIRVRDRWVEQLDLRPDDTVEVRLLGGTHEPDRTIQTVPIRGSETRQSASDRLFDEIVWRRGTIEEREIGVRVELGVRSHRHVDRLVFGGERGLTV